MKVPSFVLQEWTVDQLTFAATTMAGMSAICYAVAQLCEGQGIDPSGPEMGYRSSEGVLEDISAELRSRGIETPE